ncbi:MAG: GNAT family N-acetyltransferase [Anaerolineae bacterium]|nr:GNAT family N-acetyltransferase [Anaerolineae bacterium]
MKLVRLDDASVFSERVQPFLLKREALHCLMLGLCATLIRTNEYPEPPYLAYVEDGGAVIAAALRTPPHRLVVSDTSHPAALNLIAEDVYKLYGALPGAHVPNWLADHFARCWTAVSGQPAQLNMAQRVYQLVQVKSLHAAVPGEVRPMESDDRALITDWIMGFHADALTPISTEQAEQITNRYLTAQPDMRGLYFWVTDDTPVSMAGYTGPTPHGIRVGPVYTPPEHRRKGYAGACVAALSQELLNQGREYCFLFTDLGNPTSNHIYQEIGYEPVADIDDYRFGDQ